MKITVPQNCLIVVADGSHAMTYRNTAASGITLRAEGELQVNLDDGHGVSKLPNDTSPKESEEANMAKHIAESLYKGAHQKQFDALVLIADPQTLGQIRPHLHKEVEKLITGELPKTLTKSSVQDIEKALDAAAVSH